MHIDAHQHFWHYDPEQYDWIDSSMAALRRNFLPDDLRLELNRSGFQASVAVQARQSLEETRWLLELAARASFIAGVVGWVDLRSPDIRTLLQELARNRKLVGIRHVVQAELDDRFLLHPDFLRGISCLEEFDLAYDILIYTKHLPVAAEFVAQFPNQRFVLDHLAKPLIRAGKLEPWAEDIHRLAEFPNVYAKLSGLVTEADWLHWTPEDISPYLDIAFNAFGPDRLMIGSDWPVCLVASTYPRAVSVVTGYIAQQSDACQQAILGGNAARFWRLEDRTRRMI